MYKFECVYPLLPDKDKRVLAHYLVGYYHALGMSRNPVDHAEMRQVKNQYETVQKDDMAVLEHLGLTNTSDAPF